MTECNSCETILAGGGGFVCLIKRNRKYLIGFVAGAIVLYIIIRLTHKKGGKS